MPSKIMCHWSFVLLQVYVCCDPGDFKKSFRSSGMYQIIDKCRNSILLYITIPPLPKNKQTKGYKPHQRSNNRIILASFSETMIQDSLCA